MSAEVTGSLRSLASRPLVQALSVVAALEFASMVDGVPGDPHLPRQMVNDMVLICALYTAYSIERGLPSAFAGAAIRESVRLEAISRGLIRAGTPVPVHPGGRG